MGEQTGETKEGNKDLKDKQTQLDTEGLSKEDSGHREDSAETNVEDMYEQSMRQIQEGELVKGEIIKIDEDYVLVDIGYKSEGLIPIREFKDSEGEITAKVGEKIDVVLERREDEEGIISLSIEKAKKIKVWDDRPRASPPTGTDRW